MSKTSSGREAFIKIISRPFFFINRLVINTVGPSVKKFNKRFAHSFNIVEEGEKERRQNIVEEGDGEAGILWRRGGRIF